MPVDRALRQLEEEILDRVADRGGGGAARRGDGLDRTAFRDFLQEFLVGRGEPGLVGDGLDERLDDLRVEDRTARRDFAHRARELVAFRDAVLQQVRVTSGPVREERDRVVRVVELRQHDDAGAGVALPDELRRVDPFLLEARRHADVGDEHLRGRGLGAAHETVVVVRGADHFEVVLEAEQRADALSHDDVVVSEEHRDPPVGHMAHSAPSSPVRQGGPAPSRAAVGTPSTVVVPPAGYPGCPPRPAPGRNRTVTAGVEQ